MSFIVLLLSVYNGKASISLLFNWNLIQHLCSYYSEEMTALWAAPIPLNFTLRRIKANYINLS